MAKKKYIAQGWPGTLRRPKLRKDVLALTDTAKRKRKLERTVADNQKRIKRGKKSRTVLERDIDRFTQQFIKRSGVKGTKAATTARQAVKEYWKRVTAKKGK